MRPTSPSECTYAPVSRSVFALPCANWRSQRAHAASPSRGGEPAGVGLDGGRGIGLVGVGVVRWRLEGATLTLDQRVALAAEQLLAAVPLEEAKDGVLHEGRVLGRFRILPETRRVAAVEPSTSPAASH